MPKASNVILAVAAVVLAAACAPGSSSSTNTGSSAVPIEEPSASPAETLMPSAAAVICEKSDDPGPAVVIKDFLFDPDKTEIAVGETVVFTNEDTAPHSAVMDDRSCSTANLLKGRSEGLAFLTPGTYPYFCGVHPDMKGTIKVR